MDPTYVALGAFIGGFAVCKITQRFGGVEKLKSRKIPPRDPKDEASPHADDIEMESDEEYEAPEGGIVSYGVLDAPYKMVLCVNMSLKMDKGKIAAQCGHATLGAYKTSLKFAKSNVQWWERTGQAKIAVKVTEEQMFAVAKAAEEIGVANYIVMDAGKTQIAAGSQTVCAIGPAPVHVINEITKSFKLL